MNVTKTEEVDYQEVIIKEVVEEFRKNAEKNLNLKKKSTLDQVVEKMFNAKDGDA
jgi:hypothetical protein